MKRLIDYAMPSSGPSRVPLVIEPASSDRDLPAAFDANREAIEERLLEHGAVLFRGFDVSSVKHFEHFGERVSPSKLAYTYRSTPRTSIGSGVFTATAYPPDQEIALQCENAYQRDWPLKLAFCCLVAPEVGGETPLADVRRVTAAIGDRLLDKFESKGVRYVRHYRPDVDIPWQSVFQTSDPDKVGAYCDANEIEYEWLEESLLRTSQINQGTARHPQTGERVFFNQAHLFHVSSLGDEMARMMIDLFGDELPRSSSYGDGQEIPVEDLEVVRRAFREASMKFPWSMGDVLLVDNMQMAHGRRPFKGKRKVIVSMFDSFRARRGM